MSPSVVHSLHATLVDRFVEKGPEQQLNKDSTGSFANTCTVSQFVAKPQPKVISCTLAKHLSITSHGERFLGQVDVNVDIVYRYCSLRGIVVRNHRPVHTVVVRTPLDQRCMVRQ
jgi:hypothetical protein